MRTRFVVAFTFLSVAAHAQSISGTFDAAFTSFNQYGVPTVHMSLALQCSLSCMASAPDLHYGYGSSTAAMVAAPTLSPGDVSIKAVDDTGTVTWDSSAPAGANFTATVKSATCFCGNITGEGGYIDLTSPTVHVPPFVNVLANPVTVGQNPLIILNAAPVGSETVDVHVSGGGVDYSHSYTAADFMTETSGNVNTKTHAVDVTFTTAGMVTITASVTGGPMSTQTFAVVGAGAGGGGGGSSTGGGSSSGGGAGTGGGSGTGGGGQGGGCAAAPGLLPLAAMLWLRRRARR